ncbi:MAG: hypothetical protein HC880_14835 [Bacteroidia bacterium]|nr:hypothetical protein [Bacteroidia bacterium]
MQNIMLKSLLTLLLFVYATWLPAQVQPARIFGEYMILQRGIPIPLWGTAKPGEKISIVFRGQPYPVQADRAGAWQTKLAAAEAGGPYTLEIKGKNNQIRWDQVMVGDVWICSGQSNMEWPLMRANNPEEEIKNAQYPNIRIFTVKRDLSTQPIKEFTTVESWQPCTPESARTFSAVAYFFGRDLHQHLNVPIGLIHTSWGGTNVETWISGPAITQNAEEYREKMAELQSMDMKALAEKKQPAAPGTGGRNSYPRTGYGRR